MSTDISTNKLLLTSTASISRRLAVSNLPDSATEETIKECFERHGHVQSVRINDQRFAFITFLDRHTASKAHNTENILDKQQLQTAFHDGSNSVPKIFLQAATIEPSSSSSSSATTMTNTSIDKAITTSHEERDKHISRTASSPEENTRHQVVPIKRDGDSTRIRRKSSLINNSKITTIKSVRSKYKNSPLSSESESSHENSSSRQHVSSLKRSNCSKTRILKVYHLPSDMSTQSLRKKLENIFVDFKKSSYLLAIKIIDDYALLTFQKSKDVDKALLFIVTKSINGVKLKAEPYDSSIVEDDEHDVIKHSKCSELDRTEYSVKATRTLYIGNLQSGVSHNELRDLCSEYGDIIEIDIKRQQLPVYALPFAFIQYTDIKSVVKALNALKSKSIRDHSVKFGFGKSQPTNILWVDNLSLNTTESILRSFLIQKTNLTSEDILDIYLDKRNCQKNQSLQCLIYFVDIIAAQNVINSIRGKKLESKRIQVDFASQLFLTRFSDIIQQNNDKKTNDRTTNQTYTFDRRYSKVSDAESSLTPIISGQSQSVHRSSTSSDHSSINQRKIINSDKDTNINTERVFTWLMQNHHSDVHHDEEENPVEKLSVEAGKQSNGTNFKDEKCIDHTDSQHSTQKFFQTKNIPLESDPSFVHVDIRLQIYSSLYKQSIKAIHLPFPHFAKTLMKSSHCPIILNPKAYLKHLSFGSNHVSIKPTLINTNTNLDDISKQEELDERIRLLDKQISDIDPKNLLLPSTTLLETPNQTISVAKTTSNPQQTSSFNFSPSPAKRLSEPSLSTCSPMSSTVTRRPSESLTNCLSPSKLNGTSITNPSSLFSHTDNHLSNIVRTKLLDRLGPSAKLKQKPISPPSVPTTSNDSSILLSEKSITSSSILDDLNQRSTTTSSSVTQQIINNHSKPTVLKSILKQPSSLSQTPSHEARKVVHIASTNLSSESDGQRRLSLDDKKKPISQQTTNPTSTVVNKHEAETKKLLNQSIKPTNNIRPILGKIPKKPNIKPIEPIKKFPSILKNISTSSIDSKVSPPTIKHSDTKSPKQLNVKPINHSNKIQKTTTIPKMNKKPISSTSIQQKKTFLSNAELIKHSIQKKSSSIIKQSSIKKITTKANDKNKFSKNKFKIRQNISMYDRIKRRSKSDANRMALLLTEGEQLPKMKSDDGIQSTNTVRLKRHISIIGSSESESETLFEPKTKKIITSDRSIFDTEETGNTNIDRTSKLESRESSPNKKKVNITQTNSSFHKRPIINESDGSWKKIKLEPVTTSSIYEGQPIKSEISTNHMTIEDAISSKNETNSSNQVDHLTTSKANESIPMIAKEEAILDNSEIRQQIDTVESDQHARTTSINTTSPNSFNQQQNSIELSSQILTDKSISQSIEKPPRQETIKESEEHISQTSVIAFQKSSISFEKKDAEAVYKTCPFLIDNIHPLNLSSDHQTILQDESSPSKTSSLSVNTKPSCFPPAITNETLNSSDLRTTTSHKHPPAPMQLFPQMLTPDSSFSTPRQHFSYPFFVPPPPDSPSSSIRTLSPNSCTSVNPFYNTPLSGQPYCYDSEFRRDSITKFSITSSSSNHSTPSAVTNQQPYFGLGIDRFYDRTQSLSVLVDSLTLFRNPSEPHDYTSTTQQLLNPFYYLNDIQSLNPYNIQWEGYIMLKTDQAYVKTQLIFGNPQIARLSINYWNCDLHQNLRISQRMRLEESQLDGVQKHMQMDNDYCILIAEPNGLTPAEIRLEQNHLKNGVIQYLNEKKAAGIINILVPGVVQPVYVVHIFPPCQFASEILQKRAPDAYRCVVQNKTEQIYLLFIITTTFQ